MITFDDGYHDVYKHALPLMKKYEYRGIVSIIPAYIDESDYLSGKQIRELQENEWELSSHTWHHPFLTKIPSEQLDTEVKESKSDIEKWFGIKINTFVYPGGFYNDEIIEKVQKAGYRYGMSTQPGYANL
jgi:peptidoglycan/xylan/chitin deacetylase (PgdA/CDA1 family)